jgi:hypothetical protein
MKVLTEIEKHVIHYPQYYVPGGILQPETHYRLAVDIPRFAQRARILPKFIYTSMVSICGQDEVAWFKSMNTHVDSGIAGLMFTGLIPHVEDRMQAIAGACIRNFIDARVYTLQEVIEDQKEGSVPDCKVLLIPNFYLNTESGSKIAAWQSTSLLGLLYTRYQRGCQTVIYVENMTSMAKSYGGAFKAHFDEHYTCISG